jgi:hypothetical protein
VSLVLVLLSGESAVAGVKSREKTLAEPNEDKATVYFFRPMKWSSGARTMFLYADETFLGVVEANGYTFACLEPGRHLLWLNWAQVTKQIDVEADTTLYFWVFDHFSELDEDEGRRRIREAAFFTTPNDNERETAQRHIDERYDKALAFSSSEASGAGPKDRGHKAERRIAKWPPVHLDPYSFLYIEDFLITDPKAAARKNQDYAKTAPERLADFVADDESMDLFKDVRRGSPTELEPRSVILRVEVTRYKPALYGKGFAAYLNYTARLIDGESNEELGQVAAKRGSGYGIDQLESTVARELSAYLQKCKDQESSAE